MCSCQIWEIPTEHFDPDRVRNDALQHDPIPLSCTLVEGSTYSRAHLKARLFKQGLKARRCELCGQDETWHGRRMAVILDHVNGVANDNRIENLQIVCPNCAATLIRTAAGRTVSSATRADASTVVLTSCQAMSLSVTARGIAASGERAMGMPGRSVAR
jgi:hypothetical protein